MSQIKRVIILLDIMAREDYDHCISLHRELSRASTEEIWSHYAVIGAPPRKGVKISKKSPVVETYLLIHHLNERGIPYRLWYDNALFIFNDDLYRITDSGVVREELEGTCFVSLRDSWRHPFFRILRHLLESRGGKLAKPNLQTMENTGCMNKFYGIRELYPYREQYLHDIAIPFNLKPRCYPAFLDFLRERMDRRVVFKIDCIQEGRGVVFKDLADPAALAAVTPLLDKHMAANRELFVTPAYRIVREFRCYFTRKEAIRLFSVKERVNHSSLDQLVAKENIQIYKNISVKWHEVKPDSAGFDRITQTATALLDKLSYSAGCVEFADTEDGKTVFFEVNQMAGPLPFAGEDLARTSAYYDSMFDMILDLGPPTMR